MTPVPVSSRKSMTRSGGRGEHRPRDGLELGLADAGRAPRSARGRAGPPAGNRVRRRPRRSTGVPPRARTRRRRSRAPARSAGAGPPPTPPARRCEAPARPATSQPAGSLGVEDAGTARQDQRLSEALALLQPVDPLQETGELALGHRPSLARGRRPSRVPRPPSGGASGGRHRARTTGAPRRLCSAYMSDPAGVPVASTRSVERPDRTAREVLIACCWHNSSRIQAG